MHRSFGNLTNPIGINTKSNYGPCKPPTTGRARKMSHTFLGQSTIHVDDYSN